MRRKSGAVVASPLVSELAVENGDLRSSQAEQLDQFVTVRPCRLNLPLRRWFLLACLLLAEVIVLTVCFDGEALSRQEGLWARLVTRSHHLPYLAVAILSALGLFAGRELWSALVHSAPAIAANRHLRPFLLGHLAAFALFAGLTRLLLASDSLPLTGAWWAAAWFLAGLAVLVFWGLAVLPARVWARLGQRSVPALALGTAVGAAAWIAGQGAENLGVLNGPTFDLVYRMLGWFCPDALCYPEDAVVGTDRFSVEISPQCAGYEGIGLILVLLTVYLWWCRHTLRFPQALVLLPLGVLVMFLANAARIVALILIGSFLSPDVALGGFHSQAGWLAFNGVAVGLVYGSRRLAWFARTDGASDAFARVPPTCAYLVPLLALVALSMLSTALSAGFDWLYPLRVVVVGALLWKFRAAYPLSWNLSWSAVGLGVLVFLAWLAFEPLSPETASGQALAAGLDNLPRGWALFWLASRVIGAVMIVPLAEEIAFRGYLLRRFQAGDFQAVPLGRLTWFAFVASSLLFGLLHGRWVAGTMAGMVYALALHRRGKLVDAVLAHAVTNGLLAAYVLMTGSWGLWV